MHWNKKIVRSFLGFAAALIIIPALYVLAEEPTTSQEPDLEQLVENIKTRQYEVLEEAGCTSFMADTIYRERKKNGEIKKEILTKKRIYTKGADKRYDEYLSMSINGKELSKKEMEKEIEDDKDDDEDEFKMPLTPEGEGGYDFYLIGDTEYDGVDVWILGFRAKESKKGYVNGKGYIAKGTYDIVRAEVAPAKVPRIVKDINISVTSAPLHGYWMPAKFELDLKIKLSFLYYKRITISEAYSDYMLNRQIDESIFEKE